MRIECAAKRSPRGQRRSSDLAIVTALILRTVFDLPLRQTEGFVSCLVGLMGLTLKTPDQTTLSRPSRDIKVPRFARSAGPLNLVIDSTGLKMLGDRVPLAHKHKTSRSSGRRRGPSSCRQNRVGRGAY